MRLAVVTPFVDRQHGSERAVAELIERLSGKYNAEVHLFAQRVCGINVEEAERRAQSTAKPGMIAWHRVPSVGGPHLRQFLYWFRQNQSLRRHSQFDLVFSPGVNCADADVILVHASFSRLRELAHASEFSTGGRGLFRRLHRRAYYATVSSLESRLYRNPRVKLAAVSSRTAKMLGDTYKRTDVHVVPNGVNLAEFSERDRLALRSAARERRGFSEADFVLLLVGNDWLNKGLITVFEALAKVVDLPFCLLIVGEDVPAPFRKIAEDLGVAARCVWERSRPDVVDFYAAADVYVSPTREDSFGLPVLEAMACGLPAITSVDAGVSELITNDRDGFVLLDPRNAATLATLLRHLYGDRELGDSVGRAAARTAAKWTWDHHAESVWKLLQEVCATKART